MKNLDGLAVLVEDSLVCLACAEKIAIESGYARLFWMANRLQQVSGEMSCACGDKMDSDKAAAAAERVIEILNQGDGM